MDSQADWKKLAWKALLTIELHCENLKQTSEQDFQADIKSCDYRSSEMMFILCSIKSTLSILHS